MRAVPRDRSRGGVLQTPGPVRGAAKRTYLRERGKGGACSRTQEEDDGTLHVR